MPQVLCGVCAVKACPGVCVAERIADYCEAVLDESDLCKPGLRCCVSRDSYADGELPDNLVLMDRNGSRPTSGTVLWHLFICASNWHKNYIPHVYVGCCCGCKIALHEHVVCTIHFYSKGML
jgi:hypothetical protein